jgi:hypothetical protein
MLCMLCMLRVFRVSCMHSVFRVLRRLRRTHTGNMHRPEGVDLSRSHFWLKINVYENYRGIRQDIFWSKRCLQSQDLCKNLLYAHKISSLLIQCRRKLLSQVACPLWLINYISEILSSPISAMGSLLTTCPWWVRSPINWFSAHQSKKDPECTCHSQSNHDILGHSYCARFAIR